MLGHVDFKLDELLQFIKDNNIQGVLFLDGDRHHSEVTEVQKYGMYPLYGITASALTSGNHKWSGPEKNNSYRVMGEKNIQNFSKITVSEKRKERMLKEEFFNPPGEKLTDRSVTQIELSNCK